MLRLLADPRALLGLCIVIGAILTVERIRNEAPPAQPAPLMRQFAAIIDEQYHDCVPLGWFPDIRPWRGYFPVFNANVADKGAWFQAIWVGEMPTRLLGDPRGSAVKAVLDELVARGLLVRHDLPGLFRYNLTHEGERYYYERDHLGNNNEGWAYMCYSRLHAKDVAWASRPAVSAGPFGDEVTARIRFAWEPAEEAPWATPFLKAHAVELSPTSNPAEAKALRYPNGRWVLSEYDFAFPLVEHPAAWLAAR